MENYPRNPLVILIFSATGMIIRYGLFYLLSILKGTTPKKMKYYSEGFNQIAYNILITVFIFIVIMTLGIYYSLE